MTNKTLCTIKALKKPWGWWEPIYGTNYVLFAGKYEDMQTWLSKHVGEAVQDADPAADAMTFWIRPRGMIVLWFSAESAMPYIRWQTLIAHEAQHATHDVLSHTGMAHVRECDEAYSYYLGWLVEEIGSRLKVKPVAKKPRSKAKKSR